MPVLRFRDGQMVASENITGLIKRDSYPDNRPLVCVLFQGGQVEILCEDEADQENLLEFLSKQLEQYITPLDIEADVVNIKYN